MLALNQIAAEDKARSMRPHLHFPTIIDYVRHCIAEDNLQAFYHCRPWKRLAKEVLNEHKHECQICKRRGQYKRATLVHHEKHIRQHPELAMSKVYRDADGTYKRNLTPACQYCHEVECHPERMRHGEKPPPLTKERW